MESDPGPKALSDHETAPTAPGGETNAVAVPDPPGTPQGRTGRLKWFLAGAAVLFAVLLVVGLARGSDSGTSGPVDVGALSKPVTVAYEVDGSARGADLTLETPTGTRQEGADLPVRNKNGGLGLIFHDGFSPGDFVYVSAQNQTASGTVTCRIKVNGRVVSENTSGGAYGIATCKGSA